MSQLFNQIIYIIFIFSLHFVTSFSQIPIQEKYLYDNFEKRITKESSNLVTYYISPNYEETYSNDVRLNSIKYVEANGQKIAVINNEEIKYRYSDHLNSSARTANSKGAFSEALWYAPYGSDVGSKGKITIKNKYTGQEQDNTELYNYEARYYNPSLGRFLAADSWLPNIFDSQQLNRYTYTKNNPIRLIDPTGHSSVDTFESHGTTVREPQRLPSEFGYDLINANRDIREYDQWLADAPLNEKGIEMSFFSPLLAIALGVDRYLLAAGNGNTDGNDSQKDLTQKDDTTDNIDREEAARQEEAADRLNDLIEFVEKKYKKMKNLNSTEKEFVYRELIKERRLEILDLLGNGNEMTPSEMRSELRIDQQYLGRSLVFLTENDFVSKRHDHGKVFYYKIN